jgi:uncharacterized LabA/DUF88 family protein
VTSVTVASATRSAERVAAYIDGFNLYFGIREHGRRYLWLDLEGLLQSLLKPHQQLVAVRYFTARVRNDAPAEQRQQVYLNALAAHCSLLEVRQGRFQEKSKTCHSCGYSYKDYEEKESDVSLAVSLVEDGVRGLFDTALIISADGDMAPGICALRRLKPDARILAAFPPNRRSQRMAELCDVTIPIGLAKVRQAQLPETVMAGQHPITRPDHWK